MLMQKTAENCRLLRENGNDIAVFDTHSLGLYTGRDTYAYNFSRNDLKNNMGRLIDTFNEHKVYPAFYRPFVPMWVYFDGVFNGNISRLSSIFPTSDTENLAIVVSGKGSDWFDAFITDRIVDYGFMSPTQLFPLYIYTEVKTPYGENFQKHDNITDRALNLFRSALKNKKNKNKNKDKDNNITKEDIFFYVFGLLSTSFYVEKCKNNLSKELPTVPILDRFREISKLGRQLAGVQLIYQQYVWAVVMKEDKRGFCECAIVEENERILLLAGFYPILISQAFMWWDVITKEEAAKRIFPILVADGSNLIEYVEDVKLDKENRELLINGNVKVKDIPEFALKFKIGGCSPIEWVSRYLVRQEDKETGIVWDPRLRVEEFIDIVRKLITFSWMCLEIKQKLEELYVMSDKSRGEEMIINEVFNLDLYECVDEYTDKGSGKMPDFYLRSKEEGLPDLAIEVKTLRRDLDRPEYYEGPIPKYSLSFSNFWVVLQLNLDPLTAVSPKKILRLWEELGEKLSKYKKEWEYGLNEASDKKAWLEEHMTNFLLDYFFADNPAPRGNVRLEHEGDNLIFTVNPPIYWGPEVPVFHIEKIERYVEESKGKFEHLRKVKSDKSDYSLHWELLLVKGEIVAYDDFKFLIEVFKVCLDKNGYDYLLGVRDSGGIYYLIIRMDNGMGDDWKTQILGILNKV
ncbi:MAG: hypothetical protein JHC25_00885 [Thermodesulfobacterium sp.]|nr:hypothetical protein [Thermodesulfobacterium sp.]